MAVQPAHSEGGTASCAAESTRMTLILNQCCCGCSLRTGTAIIAVFMLTISLMLTIYASVVLGTYEVTADDYHNLNENTLDYFDRVHRRVTYEPGFRLTLISTIVGSAIQCVLNSVLLLGVSKERRSLVLTWLVAYTIILGLCILAFVIGFFQVPAKPIYQTALFVNIVMYAYFLLVVRSYHRSLPVGRHGQQNVTMMIGGEETNIKPVPLK